jgi:transcriptional regulator with GAF, ATPase, and Fis domain
MSRPDDPRDGPGEPPAARSAAGGDLRRRVAAALGRAPELDAAERAAVDRLFVAAVERERLAAVEARRQRRFAELEKLLPQLASALDPRQVFLGCAPLVRAIVPNDVLAFSWISPDRGGVRVQAATAEGLHEMPEYRFTTEIERLDSNWDYLVAHDLEPVGPNDLRVRKSRREEAPDYDVIHPGERWVGFVAKAGIRSSLRVPIRAQDRPIGGIAFLSRTPFAYDDEDGEFASRIADHLALAFAFQELAQEARRIAVAEERASQLEERVEVLSRELERFSAHRALGGSPAWKRVLAEAAQVASTDTTVLVTGESGTGKEVVARYLHRGSARAKGPFVAINCAALPEQLLESELFGHERGAFTGALQSRAGRIEQAAGGTLFLDEVGEMSPAVQAKFLRVLQEREFQRVGGSRTLKADVRVVAATNRDPRRAIERGELREDLYYRLSVFELKLPPLRERPEDILVLAEAFLEELGEQVGKPAAGLSEDARAQLVAHAWPGNVRELRNAIERAVILCRGGLVTSEHLPTTTARAVAEVAAAIAEAPPGPREFPAEGIRLDAVERELLTGALARARQNKSRAAKLLGLSRGQLYSLLRRHGLTDAKR